MISNFKLYSTYYDLLYNDKDYKSEAAYVNHQLRHLLPGARDILELGSGTGNHAQFLCELGYKITGVERSQEMIELARKKSIVDFNSILSDITSFEFNHQFDAAISLFHSMCYLTTNDQLLASFNKIAEHLKPGGIFAFDFWHGPAVIHHLPVARSKYQEDEFIAVSRRGETTMYVDKNIAEVNYEIVVKDKSNGRYEAFNEKHPMRYFSIPEIAFLASQTGFTPVKFEEYLTGNQPTLESWNIFAVLQKTA